VLVLVFVAQQLESNTKAEDDIETGVPAFFVADPYSNGTTSDNTNQYNGDEKKKRVRFPKDDDSSDTTAPPQKMASSTVPYEANTNKFKTPPPAFVFPLGGGETEMTPEETTNNNNENKNFMRTNKGKQKSSFDLIVSCVLCKKRAAASPKMKKCSQCRWSGGVTYCSVNNWCRANDWNQHTKSTCSKKCSKTSSSSSSSSGNQLLLVLHGDDEAASSSSSSSPFIMMEDTTIRDDANKKDHEKACLLEQMIVGGKQQQQQQQVDEQQVREIDALKLKLGIEETTFDSMLLAVKCCGNTPMESTTPTITAHRRRTKNKKNRKRIKAAQLVSQQKQEMEKIESMIGSLHDRVEKLRIRAGVVNKPHDGSHAVPPSTAAPSSGGDYSAAAILRLKHDLVECQAGTLFGIAAAPMENAGGDDDDDDDDNIDIFSWVAVILGPKNTPWEGGRFGLVMDFPQDYPFQPPTVQFTTPGMIHPNICPKTGQVFMDFLGDTVTGGSDCWSPAWCAAAVLMGIQSLLNDPNTRRSINKSCIDLYEHNRSAYYQRVRRIVQDTETMVIPEHLDRMLLHY
jgi:ubiquitin-protein ligase